MILVAMGAEVTVFERLREEYESCPDFGEYISRYETGLLGRYMSFCYMTDIYFDFVSYVFSDVPQGFPFSVIFLS